MASIATFFKSIFQNNPTTPSKTNNITSNDNSNYSNDHNAEISGNNNLSINNNSIKSFEHVLPLHIWEHILSLLPPDELYDIAFTCSFMHQCAGQPAKWIKSLERTELAHLLALNPFPSYLSLWANKRRLSWKYVREKVKILGPKPPNSVLTGTRFKCVLLGNRAAGKTCLVTKVANPNFFKNGFCASPSTTPHPIGTIITTLLCSLSPPSSPSSPPPSPLLSPSLPTSPPTSSSLPTSSSTSSSLPISSPETKKIELELWDMSGHHSGSNSLVGQYVKDADGIMIVYDVTNTDTFTGVEAWREVINRTYRKIPILLVGLKADLPRKVPQQSAMFYARINNMAYAEVSAKANLNIFLPFQFFVCVAKKMFALPLRFLNDKDGLAP